MVDLDLHQQPRKTAHQLVRDTLRRAILTGRISAGTRLVQAEIADQLQVSTTPVREALRDLATEGFIQLDAHRGAVVRQLSNDDALEIYNLRKLLEPEAMRLAVERITPSELATAEELCRRGEAEHDTAAWVDLNHDFHAVFTKAARSPRLTQILTNLADSAGMYVATSLVTAEDRREEANAQHRALLEAVRARDADRACAIIIQHLQRTIDSIDGVPGQRDDAG